MFLSENLHPGGPHQELTVSVLHVTITLTVYQKVPGMMDRPGGRVTSREGRGRPDAHQGESPEFGFFCELFQNT